MRSKRGNPSQKYLKDRLDTKIRQHRVSIMIHHLHEAHKFANMPDSTDVFISTDTSKLTGTILTPSQRLNFV